MQITKNIQVTIQVSDADTKECSPLCSQYDFTDYDNGKHEYCVLYSKSDTKGIRCKDCITDFGVGEKT